MAQFLTPITETDDALALTTPIILIDVSGSTDDRMKNSKTIREYEFDLTKKLLEKHKEAHVICWSDKAFSLGKLKHGDLNNLTEIYQKCKAISSGTHVVSGLSLINNTFFDPNNTTSFTDIVIITDGEISDNSKTLAARLNELSTYRVNIKIIAVERGNKNYLTTQCEAGNAFYKMIRDNGMLRLVNKFLIYNELDTEFVNFSNPRVPDTHVPFRECMFKRDDLPLFVNYVPTLVQEIMDQDSYNTVFSDCDEDAEETEDEAEVKQDADKKAVEDRMKYIKLAHDLSLTIFHFVRYSNTEEKEAMTTLFSNMFKEVPRVYKDVQKLIVDEVNNHLTGQSTMFVENI